MTDQEIKGDESSTRKRTNAAFRALINDMMVQLRIASQNELWTPEARARAEADLARIMDSVRREAVSDRGKES